MLDGCKAIGLGSWSNCKLPVDVSWTLLDLMIENLQPLGIPIVHNLPFGHGRENWLWRANQNYKLVLEAIETTKHEQAQKIHNQFCLSLHNTSN